MLMISIIVSDFSYTAVQYTHNENTSFIIETDTASSSDNLAEQVVPAFREFFIALFCGQNPGSDDCSGKLITANLSPHGWCVPIYLDDRTFLI